MDWNDSETIRMLESIGKLQSELAAANARISELERCCVVDGSGEPLKMWGTAFIRDALGELIEFEIQEFDGANKFDDGSILVSGITSSGVKLWFHEKNKDCYSSPESVPEGEK